MKYDFAVLIGRFQPFHNAHLQVVIEALGRAEKLIIVLGSKRCAPNVRNPWTVEEREMMITGAIGRERLERVTFVTVRDYLYNDMVWMTEVQQKVREISGSGKSICLVGSRKDYTSYYLEFFTEMWKPELSIPHKEINSTIIRDSYFGKNTISMGQQVPYSISMYLTAWKTLDVYKRLVDEWHFVEDYKAMTQVGPHPVQFITVDAVVVCSGHVLIVRRKGQPGKGLLALPGGFLNPTERIENAVFRELKEETRITVPKTVLRRCVRDQKVFDHPNRSNRGRTITHAFYVKLDDRKLPDIKASSDAEDVFWMPVSDIILRENEFYEDHVHIISSFLFSN